MLRRLIFFLWLLPFTALGQYRITGKVTDLVDKKPVANASVFLNNASAGSKTNDDGTFTITGVRGGQYELVVSVVGYTTYRQTILVNSDITLPVIEIISKAIELREVNIHPDPNWAKHYDMFREEFLGHSENAAQCKILNPKVIYFQYDNTNRELTASSSDFIEIENKALGYKVKYQLSSFTKNYSTSLFYFEGTASFENLQGSKSAIRRWDKNRLKTYEGSSMNFLRSVIIGGFHEQGFTVLRLIRKPNPGYSGGLNNKYLETLVTTSLTVSDFVKLTDKKGIYALSFSDCLYVLYNEAKNDKSLKPLNVASILTFEEPYSFFDNNGIIINPQSVIFEGQWAKSRVADLLPVDYEPVKEK